ncbi:MAG: ABC transporter permease [Dehalococcoidia bacterium]
MQRYIVRRILLSIPTLLVITIITFVGLRTLLPNSVIDIIIGDFGGNDPQLRQSLEQELGLNSSIPQQYLEWMGISWFWGGPTGVLQGNLGKSLHNGRSVISEVKHRVPISLELGIWAQMIAISWSIPLGVWAAVKQDKLPDYGLRAIAILISAVPGFWIAVMIITFGSIWFNWAPPIQFKTLTQDPIAHLKIMLIPALIIGLTPSGGLLRLVRTQMLEVLREDYVRTAHAKGLDSTTVLYKHALRNALLPIVTVIGVGLPSIIAGTVIFEQIFVIPGMGRYLVDAVNRRDYPVIQGLNLIFATLLVFSVLLVDVLYAVLDPRIRYR